MGLGRQCVDHYRLLNRYCVFSHDEMVCNMAMKADSLDVVLASAVQKDMQSMIKEERELRDKVRKLVSVKDTWAVGVVILSEPEISSPSLSVSRGWPTVNCSNMICWQMMRDSA